MHIQQNVQLLPYNTFGLQANAARFVQIKNEADARAIAKMDFSEKKVLGGGSNILFASDQKGIIIKNEIKGKTEKHFKHKVQVTVGGGENWHKFVLYTVCKGYGGIENLSLIPGTVGASPVQNIGAYGVELKDVFVKCKAIHLHTGQVRVFSKKACAFGYRNSYFKNEGKDQWIILSVTFSLTKTKHKLNISYGAIRSTLEQNKITQPSIKDISDAVIAIRSSKLPDPTVIGNCGSFFKNPEVKKAICEKIQKDYPTMPFYPVETGWIKIPAGWLIEQCGWKGKRVGNTGCYKNQALVLVNHGGAKGEEVKKHAFNVIDSVHNQFGIKLSPEVNIW